MQVMEKNMQKFIQNSSNLNSNNKSNSKLARYKIN